MSDMQDILFHAMELAADESADMDERADFSPFYDGTGNRHTPNKWDYEEPIYPFDMVD